MCGLKLGTPFPTELWATVAVATSVFPKSWRLFPRFLSVFAHAASLCAWLVDVNAAGGAVAAAPAAATAASRARTVCGFYRKCFRVLALVRYSLSFSGGSEGRVFAKHTDRMFSIRPVEVASQIQFNLSFSFIFENRSAGVLSLLRLDQSRLSLIGIHETEPVP